MKVVITEKTVVSYQVHVPVATTALEAARIARSEFRSALEPSSFHHSVDQNSMEYTVLGQEGPQRFVEEELDS